MSGVTTQEFERYKAYRNILDLSLKYKYYDDIEAGIKPEEYREKSRYYNCRLYDCTLGDPGRRDCCLEGIDGQFVATCPCYKCKWSKPRHYDAVRFHRGQGSRTTMLIECKDISVGYGNPDWGAPTDREVFIIKLGKRLQ